MNNKTLLIFSLLLTTFSCSSENKLEFSDQLNNVSISSRETIKLDTQLGEKIDPEEASGTEKIEKDFIETLKNQTKQPPMLRAVHARPHGLVRATFKINNSGLDEKNKVGVFSQNNKEYKAWIRFSNGNGSPKPDSEGDVRGMAIKLMGVSGKKLLEGEANEQTQDFVMINTKSFFIRSLNDYVDFTRAVKDGGKGIAKFALFHPKTAINIYKIFGQSVANPVETAYYSSTPYKLGESAIKFGARPCAGENTTKPKNPSDTYLREAMAKTLSQKDVCYDFVVQMRKGSLDSMPIEDATKEWSEKESPYIKVATINIPKQTFDSPKQMEFAENMSYTPWHSLPEHKPLGFTNRVRKTVYNSLSKFRHAQNGTVSKEPRDFNIE